MNCDHCAHSGICKYESDARKFEETLTRYITDDDKEDAVQEGGNSKQTYTKPSCITLLFKCSKFKQHFKPSPDKPSYSAGKRTFDTTLIC
mgnify:CR=1 FL=1